MFHFEKVKIRSARINPAGFKRLLNAQIAVKQFLFKFFQLYLLIMLDRRFPRNLFENTLEMPLAETDCLRDLVYVKLVPPMYFYVLLRLRDICPPFIHILCMVEMSALIC